jgi:polar amino acid transport system permease protein
MAVMQQGIQPSIVDEIARAQAASRRDFLLKFSLTWVVIIAGIALAIWSTGNADPAFTVKWGPLILGGAGITVFICITSIIGATVLAVLGALGRLSLNPFINGAASLYVSLVRGTPLIVQIYFIFFALPQMGIVLDPIIAGIFALAFNYGAYMTEVFRAGIQAVPRGQREAAQALGMPERLIMRRIVLPQATRIVVPAIGNDFVSMIKDSSLVSVVSLQELLWRANSVGRSNQQLIQALLIAALVYWALTIIFSFFQARLEKRLAKGDR